MGKVVELWFNRLDFMSKIKELSEGFRAEADKQMSNNFTGCKGRWEKEWA
jgi:hypothetical protein